MLNLKRMTKSSSKALSNKDIQNSNLPANLNSAEQLLEQYKIAKQYILSNQKNIDPTVLALVYKRLLKATPKSKQIPKRCKLPTKLINLNSKKHQYTKLFLKPSIHNKHLVSLNVESRNLNSVFKFNDWTMMFKPQKMSFHNLAEFIKLGRLNSIFGLASGLLIILIVILDVVNYIIFNVSLNLNFSITLFMISIILIVYGSIFFNLTNTTLKQSEATSKDIIKILDRLISNLTKYIKINKNNLKNFRLKNQISKVPKYTPLQHLKNIKNNGLTWNQIAQQLKAENKDKSKELMNS